MAALLVVALGFAGAGASTAGAATGTLENPGEGASTSGITVISGWVCEAETVTITIDGSLVLEAAYGTPRGDTQVPCGDTDNGFGLLWNFNLFGDGAHTIVAAADGEEIGAATFLVTTLGEAPFEPGFSGSFDEAGFPTGGSTFSLLWQTGSQNFVIAPLGTDTSSAAHAQAAAASVEQPAAATGVLENPGAFVSGIWLFSGWVCDAEEVRLLVDGTEELIAAYGTPRGDTAIACGDTDNGFGLLWNFNLFGEGEHTVEAFADGMKFGESTFLVTGFGTDFLRDVEESYRLPGFPGASEDTFVEWSEGAQNFVIWAKAPAGAPTPTPVPLPTPSPKPSATPGGATPTPTPGGSTPTPGPTPTGGGGLCGNGVVDPGEQCDGANLNGLDCASAYLQFGDSGDCFGSGLACDSDCTFNSEDPDACICNCEEDFDCAFPDDPEGAEPPIGVDCTLLWCNKGVCPCDHLDPDDEFGACIDLNTFEDTQPNASIRAACESFAACIDDVGCFLGSDLASFYFFSTQAGICGEAQPGICDTDAEIYTMTDEMRRAICTSRDFGDPDTFRCDLYCDSCDCTNPANLSPYDPGTGECS